MRDIKPSRLSALLRSGSLGQMPVAPRLPHRPSSSWPFGAEPRVASRKSQSWFRTLNVLSRASESSIRAHPGWRRVCETMQTDEKVAGRNIRQVAGGRYLGIEEEVPTCMYQLVARYCDYMLAGEHVAFGQGETLRLGCENAPLGRGRLG